MALIRRIFNMNIAQIKKKIEAAEEKGGMTVDDRIELSEALTEEQDVIADLFQQVTEIPDLDEPEEGRKNSRDSFVDDLMLEAVRKKYKVVELKALAKKAGLSGYSGMKEDKLIQFLLSNGVKL